MPQSTTQSRALLCVACYMVLFQCMDWNIASRQSRIPESDLPHLHQKAIDLLDIIQRNLPDKTGEISKWNFEKAHNILHKVLRNRPMGKLRQHFVSIT